MLFTQLKGPTWLGFGGNWSRAEAKPLYWSYDRGCRVESLVWLRKASFEGSVLGIFTITDNLNGHNILQIWSSKHLYQSNCKLYRWVWDTIRLRIWSCPQINQCISISLACFENTDHVHPKRKEREKEVLKTSRQQITAPYKHIHPIVLTCHSSFYHS